MFDTLKIPQRVKSDIETAVDAGRIPAAIIFECSDEKTALKAANETAMAILCTSGLKPCGSCPACRKVLSGSHPDLHYLRKEESRATIKVDDIRELKRQAYMLPGDGDSSVFIIEGEKGEESHRVDIVFRCEYEGPCDAEQQHDFNQIGAEWLEISTLNTTPLYPSKLRRPIMNLYEGKEAPVYLGNENAGDPEITD